jgi:hypothetical protein
LQFRQDGPQSGFVSSQRGTTRPRRWKGGRRVSALLHRWVDPAQDGSTKVLPHEPHARRPTLTEPASAEHGNSVIVELFFARY